MPEKSDFVTDVEAISHNLEDIEERLRSLKNLSEIDLEIKKILEGSFDSEIKTFSASTGGEDIEIPHSLGRIPSGYIVIKKNEDYDVYDGSQEWTESKIYIRTTGELNGTLLILAKRR